MHSVILNSCTLHLFFFKTYQLNKELIKNTCTLKIFILMSECKFLNIRYLKLIFEFITRVLLMIT